MRLFAIKEKYNLKEENTELFNAYIGGYAGLGYYYFINKVNSDYEFRFAHSEDGSKILNNAKLSKCKQTEEFYQEFVKELTNIMNNWQTVYYNSTTMDKIRWWIEFTDGKKARGTADYPQDFKKATEIINKYFKADFLLQESKYEIKPEDNIPQRVYGIPNFMDNKFNELSQEKPKK